MKKAYMTLSMPLNDSIYSAIIIRLIRYKGRGQGPHFLIYECEIHTIRRTCKIGDIGAIIFEKYNILQEDRERN